MVGKHIELFLVKGKSGSMTTAEIAGWTGHILVGPRTELADILTREEAARNGAYILLGSDEQALGGTMGYIGRTESFRKRIKHHDAQQQWWNRLVLISARDDAFNEGHWGYLEHRMVEIAQQVQQVSLKNTQCPQPRKLSEAQASDMEAFIDQLKVVLPVLGIDLLRSTHPATVPVQSPVPAVEEEVFSLTARKGKIFAQGHHDGAHFVVHEGSTCVSSWGGIAKKESTRRGYERLKALYGKLRDDGSIELISDTVCRFTRDVLFSSVSQAGAVVLGHSCNGRKAWVTAEGISYGAWLSQQLQSVPEDDEVTDPAL